MKRISYKTRNKIISRLHLWPLALLHAKTRLILRPHDAKAIEWKNIASSFYYSKINSAANNSFFKDSFFLLGTDSFTEEQPNLRNLVVIAEDLETAKNCFTALPVGTRAKFYLTNERGALPPHEGNAKYYNLVAEMCHVTSPLDINCLRIANIAATRLYELLTAEMGSKALEPIKDSIILLLEDAIDHTRTLQSFFALIETQPQICIAAADNCRIAPLLYSVLGRTKKSIFITPRFFTSSDFTDKTARNRAYASINSYLTASFAEPPASELENIRTQLQADLELFSKPGASIAIDADSVFCFLDFRHASYNEAGREIMLHLASKANISGFYYKSPEADKNIPDIKKHSQQTNLQEFDARTYGEKGSSNWENYLLEKLLGAYLSNNNLLIEGIDYKSVMKGELRNLLQTQLPAKLKLYATIMQAIRGKGRILSGYIIPNRNSYGWLCANALMQNGIKVFEQQVLFQSAYPRYKASRSNVFSMLNEEQISIYQATFGQQKGQELVNYGSVLFKRIQDRFNNFIPAEVRVKYNLPADKKIILIATQATFTTEFLSITKIVAGVAASRKDSFVVIKLHPRESENFVRQYQEAIESAGASACTCIIKEADIYEILKASDFVVTIFSNVGMDAALVGKNVISANIIKQELPVDIAGYGLALNADTPEKLEQYTNDLLDNIGAAKELEHKRQQFISKNPELVDGKVLERITKYLSGE